MSPSVEETCSRKSNRIVWYFVPPAVLVAAGFLLFSSSGRDDAHITYWAAYSLSRYGEILNYNGHRVEQSSSLLQVLILALMGLSNVEIVTLGKASSIFFGAASLIATFRLALKVHRSTALFVAILTATSAYFVYWSYGGLESTLVAFTAVCLILTYATYLTSPPGHPVALMGPIGATTLFVLVRPEAAIVLACMIVGAILTIYIKNVSLGTRHDHMDQSFLTRLLVLLGIGATISVLTFMFRIWYFGSALPQPVIAKSAGVSLDSLTAGISYYQQHLSKDLGITIIGVLAAVGAGYALWGQVKARQVDPYVLLSGLFLVAYAFFILFSGGDWMEGGRFLAHVAPVAVMFVPFALIRLINPKRLLVIAVVLLLAVQVGTMINLAVHESTGMPAWSKTYLLDKYDASTFSWFEKMNRVNIRDIPTIYWLNYFVERILDYKGGQVYIMSGQMGMVPYHVARKHFGQIQWIDTHGLTDRAFTSCQATARRPRDSGGLQLSYKFFFKNWEAIERCGIGRPDIILDLGLDTTQLTNNGYTAVYLQSGEISASAPWFPGAPRKADQFIVVRNELVAALDGPKPILVDFGDFVNSRP
jgi:hypothetical protein